MKEREFETTEIQLQKDDVIYMFSDGYADQFGGNDFKKFNVKQFKNLITEISSETMQKQRVIIEKEFFSWSSNNKQIDDILVMGMRI